MGIPSPDLRIRNFGPSVSYHSFITTLKNYFTHIESLKKEKNWIYIIELGEKAIEAAMMINRYTDRIQIHVHLAWAYFYCDDHLKVLQHTKACQRLAFFLEDILLVHCFYLESIAYFALAKNESSSAKQKDFFITAQEKALEALEIYDRKNLFDPILRGNILFHLGVLTKNHLDNSLETVLRYYSEALELFKQAQDVEEDPSPSNYEAAKAQVIQVHIEMINRQMNSEELDEPDIKSLEHVKAQIMLVMEGNYPILKIAKEALKSSDTHTQDPKPAILEQVVVDIVSPSSTVPPLTPSAFSKLR